MSGYEGAERWERLAVTLAERGGVPADKVKIIAKPYPGGVSYSIWLPTTDGLVEIHDTSWRKNWTGWQVTVSGRDDIITRQYPRAKARGPVADQVREALTGKTLR